MVTIVNSKADVLKEAQALATNANAAKGLLMVMKSNLGPKGTFKMLVSGAGTIKITKDGHVLLKEMQIQHPTASMIARAATAQDDITGDGTTSNVILIGELMKLAERAYVDGIHQRIIAEGIDIARTHLCTWLEDLTSLTKSGLLINLSQLSPLDYKEALFSVAKTSIYSKVPPRISRNLAENVVSAIDVISKEKDDLGNLDLHMVELMTIKNTQEASSRLVEGLVLDHGTRHPDMPHSLGKCFVLTCNVSLEYEKTEVNSSFMYSSAEQREALVESERKFTDEKVRQIVDLKNKVCTGQNADMGFIVINQKGIDPPSLDILAKNGMMALRRAKRRNMERLVRACGGHAVNSFDDLDADDLGTAEKIETEVLGDDKYTFVYVDKSKYSSCTMLVRGPNDHIIAQINDAIRDGLRAVSNAVSDKYLVCGGGAFEAAAAAELKRNCRPEGKVKLGVDLFGDALLSIPRILAENSGLDTHDVLVRIQSHYENGSTGILGVNLSGEIDDSSNFLMDPSLAGVYDNLCVKKQMLMISPVLAQQLLLVDEVIRAGRQMGRG